MFGLDSNSIEPAAPARPVAARKPDPDEMPIREATPKEMRALRQAPQEVEADAVARRHNLYTADKRATRIYFTDYQQKSEVMRASPQRITTKLNDRQTVSAMLDLAQSRGWQSVKLRGTDNFKREAWVQAQVRGMQIEGYQPKATDKQEAERRQPAKAPEPKAARPTVKTTKPEKPAAQKRQASVWGVVETAGQQARQNDSSPAQKPAQKPATPSTAAAA